MKTKVILLGLACTLVLISGCATVPAFTSRTIRVTVSPVDAELKIVTRKGNVIATSKTVDRVGILTVEVLSTPGIYLPDGGYADVEASAPGYQTAKQSFRYQEQLEVNITLHPTRQTRIAQLNKALAEAEALFMKEAAPLEIKGGAVITGQAFLKTRGGDVKVGAGNPVTALPAGSAAILIKGLLDDGAEITALSAEAFQRYAKVLRVVQADAQGNFEFRELPAGQYLLHTEIKWAVPSTYGLSSSGGAVEAHVNVADGSSQKVMLTH